VADAKLERKREINRLWMRKYRNTPEGKSACREAKVKCQSSPEGGVVLRAGKRRYRKSEKARLVSNAAQRKRYVKSDRVLLTPDERKERSRQSHKRSVSKPGVREKRAAGVWRRHIWKAYGLTVDQYNSMAVHGCQICGSTGGGKKLHVDHCHASGKVRGVLCDPCNRGLGTFADSPERLEKAAAYLRSACHF
jgi:hypothetical protein